MKKSEMLVSKQEQDLSLLVYAIPGGYTGVITDTLHTLWRKDFTCPETATKKSLSKLSSFISMIEYLSLSEKYFKESQYYRSIGDDKEAEEYMKKAFSYRSKFDRGRCLGLWFED